MRKLIIAAAIVVVLVLSIATLLKPMKTRHPGSPELMERQNDPAFRAELAREERIVEEMAREAATQPSSQPSP